MYNSPRQLQPMIGTAWLGHHVVVLRCNPYTNQLLSIEKSLAAPLEPPHSSCAETLSRLLSIGYIITNTIMLSPSDIQYVLVKK